LNPTVQALDLVERMSHGLMGHLLEGVGGQAATQGGAEKAKSPAARSCAQQGFAALPAGDTKPPYYNAPWSRCKPLLPEFTLS
jgi:hypothetical protein